MSERSVNLEALGLSTEDLRDRVVERVCQKLMKSIGYDPDCGDTYEADSELVRKFRTEMKTRIDEQVTVFGETHFTPHIKEIIEATTIEQTNNYGEKTGESMTFIEYLVKSAKGYLMELVDYQGKPKKRGDSYWHSEGTRIAHMIHDYLYSHIETAMKDALKIANEALVDGIKKTVEIKMKEIVKSIKTTVGR